MKNCKLIAVSAAFAAAAAVAAPACAQFYIGAGLGEGKASDTTTSGTLAGAPFSVSGGDEYKTSFQVNGGYLFTPMWGIEVQYTDLGKRSGQVTVGAPVNGTAALNDVKAYQWGVSGTGTFPLRGNFYARAKLGVSSNHVHDATAIVTTAGGSRTYSSGGSSHTDILAGIGIGYAWSTNFATRLEYEYFGKFESNNGNSSGKGNNIGLRLQYVFR